MEVTLGDVRGCGLKGYSASASLQEPHAGAQGGHVSSPTAGRKLKPVHGQRAHGDALRCHEERDVAQPPGAQLQPLQSRAGAHAKAVPTLLFGDHKG